MSDTGRIHEPLQADLRSVLFGRMAGETIREELQWLAAIERSHVLMLTRSSLMASGTAGQILLAIDRLEADGFAAFRDREAVRGLYLLWEQLLVELLGERVGGSAHFARSRNDMNAALARLRLRGPVHSLLLEALRLSATLTRQASRWSRVLSVGYTHYQPAMPLTLGHQLAGWAEALGRDIHGLFQAADDLNRCPLGAGALGGTTLPIDAAYTARLLGFRAVASNSVDAVASRDVVLRLLAAAAITATSVSRFASDILVWSTQEFGFIRLPDSLVGSSSQMPQKRNPFVLEHVQARGMSALGAFVTAISRTHATPFTNSVAVGTESIRPAEDAIRDVTESVLILRHVVAGMEVCEEALCQKAQTSFVIATALANRLVRECRLPFREAHHRVGRLVGEAIANGEDLVGVARRRLASEGLLPDLDKLRPEDEIAAAEYGGGPGPASVSRQLHRLRRITIRFRLRLRAIRHRHQRAAALLREECEKLTSGTNSVRPTGRDGEQTPRHER